MAAARYDRNQNYNSFAQGNRHTSTSNRVKSFYRSNSTDSEQMTLTLVEDLKRDMRRNRDTKPMSQSDVESKVAALRQEANPEQCDINELKARLPRNLRDCPKAILQQSMAYGDNSDEIASIIESKMNDSNGNGNPTDTSLENVIDPLKKLRKDMDKNRTRNLFKEIRQFPDNQIDRANRLFLSEARHMAPGLKTYPYEDAKEAVRAIRDSDCQTSDEATLLAMIKTMGDYDDIRQFLETKSKKKTTQDRSRSRSPDDHRNRTPTPPRGTTSKSRKSQQDNTSSFPARRADDRDARQTHDDVLRRFDKSSDGDSSPSMPRQRPQRN